MNEEKIGYRTLSVFFHDVSLLIASGTAMEDILSTLATDCPEEAFRRVLGTLSRRAAAGDSLSAALGLVGGFPAYAVHMTQAAEEAGRLEEVSAALSRYYDRREQTRELTRSALVQPLILLSLLTLVLGAFLWGILPVLSGVYDALGGDAGMYVGAAYAIGGAAFALTALVLLAGLALWLGVRTRRGAAWVTRLWERSHITRKTALLFAQAFFISDVDVRLSGGLMTDRSFEQAAAHVRHPRLHALAQRCAERLAAGDSLGNVIVEERLLPPVCAHILYGAARGGAVTAAFSQVRELLFDEAELRVRALIARLEPVLTGFFTLAVGLSLISIMLPLIGVVGSMG